jgi:hypothetical protein
MCRSIKTLRRAEDPATDDEIRAAALQFVRKVSGYRAPSRANTEAFDAAVAEIAASSRRLLSVVGTVSDAPEGSGHGLGAPSAAHHHEVSPARPS